MHWYPDRRPRYERLLLDRYHAALSAHGVKGYDRRALTDDYRLSVLLRSMTPIGRTISRRWSGGTIWNNCRELLG
jgi:hypothetical protein